MRPFIVCLALFAATPAFAQVQSRPTDPPPVTAASESWYQLREPVPFAGELYYPAGAALFFDGNAMFRTGQYNGVPLYADATVEPYSVVLVPIGRGLMQPYERPRRGTLAGTTGSRTPSFPGQLTPAAGSPPVAAVSPTAPPTAATSGVSTPEPATAADSAPRGEPGAVGTTGVMAATRAPAAAPLVSLRRPESNDGIWIRFLGEKWISAGAAVAFAPAEFTHVGEYGAFPVFARRELKEDVIYVPTRAGLVAPYRLKE
jgi:hypothetical protein